jgi:signal transduction histidine kinase
VSATSIGRGACDDLERALLCHQPSLQPGRGLCALPDLVGVFTTSGLALDLRTEGDRGDLSTLVDWSAYRIVQEALTNVARHAPTSSTTLTVRYQPHEVYLSVIDHGPRQVGNGRYKEGRGIIGMRERAAALGGTLGAGPTPTGFAVIAHLPRSSGDAQAAR